MTVLYVVAAWLVMQVAGVLMDLSVLPDQAGPWVLGVLVIGLPIALIFSWFFEITPEGLALEKDVPEGASITHATGRRMDFIVIAILAAGLILFAADKWWPRELPERSIAVLPFENMSADPEQEFFADGISEEILNLLAQIDPLTVIARTSSFSFKGKDADIATMAEEMNVRHILEGSVRRDGSRVRITAQLIDAENSSHLWSDVYDRDLSAASLFQVQSEVARAVSRELRLTLTGQDEERLEKAPTDNTEAYTAYLLGRERLRDRKVAELRDAAGQFARAIELDPQFAHAYAGLADACMLYRQVSGGQVSQHCTAAEGEEEGSLTDALESLVRKALSIDDEVGEAWVTLGRIRMWQSGQWGDGPEAMELIREAQAAYKTGIDLSPSFSQAYDWYADSMQYIYFYDDPPNGWLTAWENGLWQSVVERGLEVDPLSLSLHRKKAFYPRYASTREEAVAHAQRITEIAPDSPQGSDVMAEIQAGWYGRHDEAIRWRKRAAERDPENSSYGFAIAGSYCVLGDAGMAMAYARQAAQLLPPDLRTVDPFFEVCDLLLSGDVHSGRLADTLQKTDDYGSLALLAMIDIAAGRAEDALARYKVHMPDFCFEDSDDDLTNCPFQVMRVMQAAGDDERARRFVEKRLMFIKPWSDRYRRYIHRLYYAEGLALLGRTDEALDILEALVAAGWRGQHYFGTPFTLEYDIVFDSIRDHPRFQALIAAKRADFAQQLENVRAMERKGELPTLQEVQAGLVVSPD